MQPLYVWKTPALLRSGGARLLTHADVTDCVLQNKGTSAASPQQKAGSAYAGDAFILSVFCMRTSLDAEL
jgi:hypothetical protein